MATIGLDKLYYAKITEDASGNETYGDQMCIRDRWNVSGSHGKGGETRWLR